MFKHINESCVLSRYVLICSRIIRHILWDSENIVHIIFMAGLLEQVESIGNVIDLLEDLLLLGNVF